MKRMNLYLLDHAIGFFGWFMLVAGPAWWVGAVMLGLYFQLGLVAHIANRCIWKLENS